MAVRTLANATNDASLADRAWQIQSTDEGMRLFALDWWVGHDKSRAREVCLQQLRQPLNEIVRVAAIRHLGGLKDVDGSHDVYDALVAVVKENSFGARTSAINALVQYGDPAAIDVIQPMTEHSLFMVRRTAVGAVQALRNR
jgi:HEAT repeat protein